MTQRYYVNNSLWERVRMPAVARFLVVSPFEVIQPFLDGPPFVTIPVGSVIETQEEIRRSPGLAEIRLDDKPLLARIRDIEDHTKPLHEPACA